MDAKTRPLVDVAILSIRNDEFTAVLDAFPHGHAIFRGRDREYTLRDADAGRGGTYKVAILRQIEQGNGEAQDAARDLIDDLDPSLVLLVGIAGGLPSDDVSLGDIVLSTRIVDFSLEARKFDDETTYSVGGGPINKRIAAGVANLSARQDELGEWWSRLPQKPAVQLDDEDFYGPNDWKTKVRQSLQTHYGSSAIIRHPVFAAGPIASSDRLIKDPEVLIPWISSARSILAVEMESAGVHRATKEKTSMLSIRSLSDIVGFRRQDAWTKYACASAASFTQAYLKTQPITKRESSAVEKEPNRDGALTTARPQESTNIGKPIENNGSVGPSPKEGSIEHWPAVDVYLNLRPAKNRFAIRIDFNRRYPPHKDTHNVYVEIPIPRDRFIRRIDELLDLWKRTFSGSAQMYAIQQLIDKGQTLFEDIFGPFQGANRKISSSLSGFRNLLISHSPRIMVKTEHVFIPWELLYVPGRGFLGQLCCVETGVCDRYLPKGAENQQRVFDFGSLPFTMSSQIEASAVNGHGLFFEELESYREKQLDVLRRSSAQVLEEALSQTPSDQLVYFAFEHSLTAGRKGRRHATLKVGLDTVDVNRLSDAIARGSLPHSPLLLLNLNRHDSHTKLNFVRHYHSYLEEFFAGGLSGVVAPEAPLSLSKTEKFAVAFLRNLFNNGEPSSATKFTVSDVLWKTKREFCDAGSPWALLYSYYLIHEICFPHQLERRKPKQKAEIDDNEGYLGGQR